MTVTAPADDKVDIDFERFSHGFRDRVNGMPRSALHSTDDPYNWGYDCGGIYETQKPQIDDGSKRNYRG